MVYQLKYSNLDYLRVTGNNAVHPLSVIDVDDYNTAISLFELVNLVVEYRITSPKRSKDSMIVCPKTSRRRLMKETVRNNDALLLHTIGSKIDVYK
jgi:hypothetical protein